MRYLITLILFILVLAGCSSAAGPSDTLSGAATGEVAAAAPTVSLSPPPIASAGDASEDEPVPSDSSTPLAATCPPLDSEPAAAEADALRVLYRHEGQWWVWREEQEAPVALPVPGDLSDPLLSPDGRLIAFQRALDASTLEIWVADSEAQDATKLATASGQETLDRYPSATGLRLALSWVGESHFLTYTFQPLFDALGQTPLEHLHLLDVETGTTRTLFPDGSELYAVAYAPDGGQIAALTPDGLLLVDVPGGELTHTLPLPLFDSVDQRLSYSPDGASLVLFTPDGVAIIDPAEESHRMIPLQYRPIGVGHGVALPGIYWLENEPAFYTLITSDPDLFQSDTSFELWKIDLASAAATPIRTFEGFLFSARFSPDRRFLAFWRQQANQRELYLTDVLSGESFLYDEGYLLEFLDWRPQRSEFLYWFFEQQELWLGHPCRESTLLPASGGEGSLVPLGAHWESPEHLLLLLRDITDGGWQLHLITPEGESRSIATIEPDTPWHPFFIKE